MKPETFRFSMTGLALIGCCALGATTVRCTSAARQAILSADQAVCAVPHALKGAAAETMADVCAIELPIAQALVAAAGDAGAKPAVDGATP